MSRNFKDGWLQAYKKYIFKQESPEIFHLWVGLTMISAALRRNVWTDRGAYKIYPNQYVILLAESATCRKSVAMEIGLDLLLANKTIKAVHERTTVEGLTDLMNKVIPTPSGKIRYDGSVVLHADELSNMFSKASYIVDLISFLTAAYTAKARLDFLTRGKGFVQIRNPCPVMLAGTTPGQFGEIFPMAAIASGFMGRVILVMGKKGDRVGKPKLLTEMRPGLVEDLKDISLLEGEIKPTDECEEFFIDWYEGGKMGEAKSAELVSFYERKHDHVMKAAMLLSISESNDLIITLDNLKGAIQLVEDLEEGMARGLEHIGATPQSDLSDLLVETLRKNIVPMQHSVLFRRLHRKVGDAKAFGDLIDALVQMERIDTPVITRKGIFYQLKKKPRKRKVKEKDVQITNT